MCGILATRGIDSPFHHGLVRGLRRRGPDAIGFWADRNLSMAHTRLSIIGLDDLGTQPMEDERHVIAYNGELYNFLEIKNRLLRAGEVLRGSSDTEVLLHAWTRWGPDILTDLVGFWAFVVYDKKEHKLTLVRDQLGIKPLYYWHNEQFTCVSSLLRTVLDVVGQSPELDFEAMSEYVTYQFTFGDKTFCKHVKKVLPGHYVEIDLNTGALTDTCYEDILNPDDHGTRRMTPELIEETRELLIQCCQQSTISDTSFTSFCSGGMDSSLITSITQPEVAYHCNYSDPDCNETFFAREVVKDLPTRLMVVNAQESFDLIQRLKSIVEDFDELTIGSVILPLDDLLTQVKRRYKVILTGSGGDELFAGYVRYQLAMGQCFQDSYRALYERMRDVPEVADRFEMTHRKGNTKLYAFYDSSVENTFRSHFDSCRNGGNDLHTMLTFDRRYFLSGLLNIDDKLCGRHSLESRPSFLHQALVRHVLRINPEDLMARHELKYLLKSVAENILPESVVRRTDKMGFTTPVGTFINSSAHIIREQITGSRFSSLYNLKSVHFTAETKFSRETFGMLMLDLWLNRYACPKTAAAAA
ncbi:MAG TPA: asparagine synthase (glutamine-hydrolyzing) [Bryobacteraceae bacterium]|nr:asparagine synthase (glutamine-hydrolyzing) [Bryobacteraceae bacterium]